MTIVREIAIYQIEGDSFIDSFEINLAIEKLIEILDVDIEDDPELYKVYEINKKKYLQLIEFVPKLSKINFDQVSVYYECYQVK